MGITLTPLTGNENYIIRGGDNHNKYGDAYDLVCVVSIESDTAHILAMCGKMNQKRKHEIEAELRAMCVKRADWSRVKKGIFLDRSAK